MTERKVLNKYYPPDFDPNMLWSRKRFVQEFSGTRKGPRLMKIRMMMPFSMCCSACGEFVYVGTKFNSAVERIKGQDYLGIPLWRFFGRCTHCRNDFSFRTDPKSTDYEPHRDQTLAETELREKKAEELEGDAMLAIEQRTYDTAKELMALDQIEELKEQNKRLLKWNETSDATKEWIAAREVVKLEGAKEELFKLTADDEDELDAFREGKARERETLVLGDSSEDEIHLPQDRKGPAPAAADSAGSDDDAPEPAGAGSGSSDSEASGPLGFFRKKQRR